MKTVASHNVDPDHFGQRYMTPARFASYSYQLTEIMALAPRRVLEIGMGNGVVAYILRKGGMDVCTIDVKRTLLPDILGSVMALPVRGGSFDLVVCFEVLEHLPYKYFGKALSEISRISSSSIILSLPDVQRAYRINLGLPKLGEIRWLLQVPRLRKLVHSYDGEHYWEIGKEGYPLSKIKKEIERIGLKVEKTYRIFEYPYHRMFILKI